jgi:3-phenylpropionate/trans-cinnamate dioxygenase ferredoxin reductase subunit
MTDGIVIVGAGEAGTRTAVALRENGFNGAVTLIGEEPHLPYERPPLSKATITHSPDLPTIVTSEKWPEFGITHRLGVTVTAIDRATHRLATSTGESIGYDRLCLATGSTPRLLPVPGADRCRYLRTYDDALELRQQFKADTRLAIVGGGVIGLELAASARHRDCAVTVIEVAPRVLTRAIPPEAADMIADRHRAAGVTIVASATLTAIEWSSGAAMLRVNGQAIAADCVVVGVGVLPNVALAADAGLAIDNGIAVSAELRTSDPDIVAVGDCASFPHPLYGGRRLRLEAWRNAQDQGTFAAKSLLGVSECYCAVPWFWSDQYELHLQIAGMVDEGPRTIARDLGSESRLFFHLAQDGRLVAASGIGMIGKVAKEVRLAEMLIAKAARPDPAALASPAVKLKGLLAA